MIIDKIENAQFYFGLGERIKKGLLFLQNNNLEKFENGRHDIEGDNIYVSVQEYQTKPESEGKLEAHREYIDIQFIVKGEEKIGYTNISNCSSVTNYDSEKDIEFLKENNINIDFATAKENYFLIFTPQDAHMPCISTTAPKTVKKAVVKVKIA